MKSVESMSSQSFGWALPFATKTKTLRPLSGALFRNCRASSSACHKRSSLPLALHNASPWHAAVLSLSLSDEEPFQTCGWILVASPKADGPRNQKSYLFLRFRIKKKSSKFSYHHLTLLLLFQVSRHCTLPRLPHPWKCRILRNPFHKEL